MRIGMMADLYKPHVSGVTMYISLNKRFFEQAGHEVFVFTFGDVDYVDDESNVIRFTGIPVAETGLYLNFRYNRRAQRLLKTMDIAHVNHQSPVVAWPYAMPNHLAYRLCSPITPLRSIRSNLYTHASGCGWRVRRTRLHAFVCKSVDLVIAPQPACGRSYRLTASNPM